MTAVKLTRHAMGLIRKYGHDRAVENTSVAVVGPAKDFRIEHGMQDLGCQRRFLGRLDLIVRLQFVQPWMLVP